MSKATLDQAKAQLSSAKVILIDLRGNGGGAGSSISYLIEDIVGPDKLLWRDKTREGLAMRKPYIFRGYLVLNCFPEIVQVLWNVKSTVSFEAINYSISYQLHRLMPLYILYQFKQYVFDIKSP